jgi:hypothetical protein
MTGILQMAEAALADEWVINGDRVALQRRVLRLGKPPRRWKRPSWASLAMREPLEVCVLLLHNTNDNTFFLLGFPADDELGMCRTYCWLFCCMGTKLHLCICMHMCLFSL